MTVLELWHRIHDAALAFGHDEAEAVRRADTRYWPTNERCPDPEAQAECAPFPILPPGPERLVRLG